MVWVGHAIVHGDVCRWPKSSGVRGHPDHRPESLVAKVIQGSAFTPSLRSAALHVSVAPGLDGVADVTVILDPVARGGTSRGRLMPSLLLGLGALDPRAIRATTRGVTAALGHRWGMGIIAVPVSGGRRLGQPVGHGATSGMGALSLLLEGDVEKSPCLMQPLIGLWVWCVGDVLQPTGGGRHVVAT
jgi:hypothetical protein